MTEDQHAAFERLCEAAFGLDARRKDDYLKVRVKSWIERQAPLDKEVRAAYEGNAALELAEFVAMTALAHARDYIEEELRRRFEVRTEQATIAMTGRSLGQLLLDSGLDLTRHLRGEVRPEPPAKKPPGRADLH